MTAPARSPMTRPPIETWGRAWLAGARAWADRSRLNGFLFEFLWFGLKQGWACLFGGAMLALILGTFLFWPANAPLARYDFLVLGALGIGLGLGLPLLNTILRAVLETSGLTDGKAFQYMAYYRTALGALPNLLAALALFYLFKGLDLGCVRWVNALAGTTLGVYILHQVPAFRGFLWNGLLQAEAHHGSVGYTLLAILAVFLGCAAVDALRTALVMRPLENTRLFKALCEKGDALAAKITADD